METNELDDEEIPSYPRFTDLRSKEAEDFNSLLSTHLPSHVSRWDCNIEGWRFQLSHLILSIEHDLLTPVQVSISDYDLPRAYIAPLRQSLSRILTTTPLQSRKDMTTFAIILLQLVEECVSWQNFWISDIRRKARVEKAQNNNTSGKGYDVSSSSSTLSKAEMLNLLSLNSMGVDLETIDRSGEHLLGQPISEILASFPSEYRIVHAEPVFRSDLVNRFRIRQQEIYKDLKRLPHQTLRAAVLATHIKPHSSEDTVENLARHLSQAKITFHGSERWNIASIVRNGLVVPGTTLQDGKTVEIAKGASYGIGIYSSPDPQFAMMYTRSWSSAGILQKIQTSDLPGLRLLVCATLMGMPIEAYRDTQRRVEGLADERAHSHVSPNKLEYIVFSAAQIIPCYVVHFDTGSDEFRKSLKSMPENTDEFTQRVKANKALAIKPSVFSKEEDRAFKSAAKSAATKWFPFGFGPATGTRFVIEDIADYDDDEEEYGEFQGERREVGDEYGTWKERRGAGSWFDEYQTARYQRTRTVFGEYEE